MAETLIKILHVLEIISIILLIISVCFSFYDQRHGFKREKLLITVFYTTLGFGIATIFVSGLLMMVS